MAATSLVHQGWGSLQGSSKAGYRCSRTASEARRALQLPLVFSYLEAVFVKLHTLLVRAGRAEAST